MSWRLLLAPPVRVKDDTVNLLVYLTQGTQLIEYISFFKVKVLCH